jgi:hypothetical protein
MAASAPANRLYGRDSGLGNHRSRDRRRRQRVLAPPGRQVSVEGRRNDARATALASLFGHFRGKKGSSAARKCLDAPGVPHPDKNRRAGGGGVLPDPEGLNQRHRPAGPRPGEHKGGLIVVAPGLLFWTNWVAGSAKRQWPPVFARR